MFSSFISTFTFFLLAYFYIYLTPLYVFILILSVCAFGSLYILCLVYYLCFFFYAFTSFCVSVCVISIFRFFVSPGFISSSDHPPSFITSLLSRSISLTSITSVSIPFLFSLTFTLLPSYTLTFTHSADKRRDTSHSISTLSPSLSPPLTFGPLAVRRQDTGSSLGPGGKANVGFPQNTRRAEGFVAAALECWEQPLSPARSPDVKEMRAEDQRRAGFVREIRTRVLESRLKGSAWRS